MSTTITPPPSDPVPGAPVAPGAPQPPETRGASRVIAILTICLGIAVVLGVLGSATFSTIAAASVRTETTSIDASGVRDLSVEVAGASLRVEFADVSEATLDVTSGLGVEAWNLTREGNELTLASMRRFGPGWLFGGEVHATLTLPQELESLDAHFDLSAGDLTVEGEFADLEIDVSAGSFSVDGTARTLSAELSAGGADIDLIGVDEAEFAVNAGALESRLAGSAPRMVSVDVSAGSLELTLPNGTYDVRSDVSAGEFDNRLRSEPGAANTVDVTVSAGTATIKSAR